MKRFIFLVAIFFIIYGTANAAYTPTGTSGHVIPFLDGNNSYSGTSTFLGAMTLPITGSTQCLHVNSSGALSGTGLDCGSGSGGITALTGDVTASGSGSVTTTLATVNANVGSFTNANITVNAKGLITGASNGSSPSITWPTTGSLVVSNSTNSPAGLAPVNGDCVVGSGGAWVAGACGSAGTVSVTAGTPDIIISPSPGLTTFTVGSNLSASNSSTGFLPIPNGGSNYNFPHFYPKLLATIAGSGNTKICQVGDSTTLGQGSNESVNPAIAQNWPPLSYTGQIAGLLTSTYGIKAHWNSYFGINGASTLSPIYDSRFVIGNSWSVSGTYKSLGIRVLTSTTNTNALAFTPTTPVDTFKIYYIKDTGLGTMQEDVNGSGSATFSTGGTASIGVQTVTATLGTNTLNMRWSSGSSVNVVGVEAYDSTQSWVSVINMGAGSSTSVDWSTATAAYSPSNSAAYTAVGCDLTTINLGINDYDNGTGASTFVTNVTNLVNAAKVSGDVLVVIPVPTNPSGHASIATQYQYTQALRVYLTANNIPYVDMALRWQSYTNASNQHYYGDTFTHPDAAGYADEAAAILTVLSPPKISSSPFTQASYAMNLTQNSPTDVALPLISLANPNSTGLAQMAFYSTSDEYLVGAGNSGTTPSILQNAWYVYNATTNNATLVATAAGNVNLAGKLGFGTGTPAVTIDASSGTDAIVLPTGTTAQRPTGVSGMLRYNSTVPQIEAYYNSAWNALGGGGGITALTGDVTASGSGSVTATAVKVNGVAYAASPSTDTVPVITAANTSTYTAMPNCTDTGGNHINYTTSTHLFSCGTSGSGGGVASFSGDGALISNVTSTGAVTATLTSATAKSLWGNTSSSSGAPSYVTSPVVSGSITATTHIPTSSTIPTDGLYLPAANTSGIADNSQPVVQFSGVASAVDYLTITNAATANPAYLILAGAGSDSNVGLALATKGTGVIAIGTTAPFASALPLDVEIATNSKRQISTNSTAAYPNAISGIEMYARGSDSGGLFYTEGTGTGQFELYGNGAPPFIATAFGGTSINFGIHNSLTALGFSVLNVTSQVDYLQVAGSTTGNHAPSITASGSDANIFLKLASKGNGTVQIASHQSYLGTAPAVSACGTSPTIDAQATDNSGTVTVGTVAAASCTVTFNVAYTNFVHCRVSSQSNIASFAYSYTKTAITVTGTSLVGDLFDYECDGQ